MKPQLQQLTSLRFFAAAAIFLVHLQLMVLRTGSYAFLGWGVTFFFVLSGFILTYVYGDMAGHGMRRFLVARLARLWPIHIATFAAFVLLVQAGRKDVFGASSILNVMLLQDWVPALPYALSHNAVSWSISAELFFYLLFPFMARSRSLLWWWLGCGALALALIVAMHHLHPWAEANGWHAATVIVLTKSPYAALSAFLLGIAAGRAFLNYRPPDLGPGVWTLAEGLAVTLLVLAAAASSGGVQPLVPALGPAGGLWVFYVGAAPLFAAFILVFAIGRGGISHVLRHRLPVLLGEISFAIYMTHWVIFQTANRHLRHLTPAARAAVCIVVTLLVSWLAWRLIERPARAKIIARFAGRARARRPRPAAMMAPRPRPELATATI